MLPTGPDWHKELIRDSAAAAGVPSRNNVFKYGFPESTPVLPSAGEAAPIRGSATQDRTVGPGANAANGFGDTPGTANMPAPRSFDAPSDQSPPLYARQTAPRLARRIADKSQSFFDTGAPAVPFVPPNNVLSPDRQNSFDNRFGNWTSSAAAPPNSVPSADRQNSFGERFGNWTSSPAGGISPRNPNLPAPPPQPGRPLGIFSGKPMPLWTTPPRLGGLLNNSNAAGNNDGFNLLAGLVSRNPPLPAPPQQTAGSIPERRLGRSILNRSPAPAYVPGAVAAPLAPSVDANYSGGPLGMYAALAGTDPQNPNQLAPPDDEQEQANIQALEDKLTSTGNINDAWELCKARLASRR